MTALTKDRNTPRRNGDQFEFGMKAATLIYAGSLVVIDSNGVAKSGVTGTGLKCVGVADDRADNSAGAANDIRVKVRKGVFRFANSASTDLIALADVNATCYIVDDQTVAKTDGTGTRSAAGTVADVDADGVWVRFN